MIHTGATTTTNTSANLNVRNRGDDAGIVGALSLAKQAYDEKKSKKEKVLFNSLVVAGMVTLAASLAFSLLKKK